ncbi:hypothetical protein [Streptomyces sp. NPDC001978]|uniref:hypothetical protein n=1 Tax=Streptomyces sp. NPDC001978 TaxID=3364627 RepID=UPI00369DC085
MTTRLVSPNTVLSAEDVVSQRILATPPMGVSPARAKPGAWGRIVMVVGAPVLSKVLFSAPGPDRQTEYEEAYQ